MNTFANKKTLRILLLLLTHVAPSWSSLLDLDLSNPLAFKAELESVQEEMDAAVAAMQALSARGWSNIELNYTACLALFGLRNTTPKLEENLNEIHELLAEKFEPRNQRRYPALSMTMYLLNAKITEAKNFVTTCLYRKWCPGETEEVAAPREIISLRGAIQSLEGLSTEKDITPALLVPKLTLFTSVGHSVISPSTPSAALAPLKPVRRGYIPPPLPEGELERRRNAASKEVASNKPAPAKVYKKTDAPPALRTRKPRRPLI